MVARQASSYSEQDVTLRLKALRLSRAGAQHGAQTIFATQVGIDRAVWSNFERGYPLPRDAAIQLCTRIPSLSLDWIFFGREDGLSVALQKDLRAAVAALLDGRATLHINANDQGMSAVVKKPRRYSGSGKKKLSTNSRA